MLVADAHKRAHRKNRDHRVARLAQLAATANSLATLPPATTNTLKLEPISFDSNHVPSTCITLHVPTKDDQQEESDLPAKLLRWRLESRVSQLATTKLLTILQEHIDGLPKTFYFLNKDVDRLMAKTSTCIVNSVALGPTTFTYVSLLDQLAMCVALDRFQASIIVEHQGVSMLTEAEEEAGVEEEAYGHFTAHEYFRMFLEEFATFKDSLSTAGKSSRYDVVIPLALQFYYDDFQIRNKKKAGGLYIAIANLPLGVKNADLFRPCLGYVPHQCDVLDCLGWSHTGDNNILAMFMQI